MAALSLADIQALRKARGISFRLRDGETIITAIHTAPNMHVSDQWTRSIVACTTWVNFLPAVLGFVVKPTEAYYYHAASNLDEVWKTACHVMRPNDSLRVHWEQGGAQTSELLKLGMIADSLVLYVERRKKRLAFRLGCRIEKYNSPSRMIKVGGQREEV